MTSTVVVTLRPPEELKNQWQEESDEKDMSLSKFVIAMTEAGRKNISLNGVNDTAVRKLRSQREDFREELSNARERIEQLEQERHHTEFDCVIEFVEENPGAEFADIVQHLIDSAPSRTAQLLDMLVGDELQSKEGHYFSTEESLIPEADTLEQNVSEGSTS